LILSFCHYVDEIRALLEYFTTYSGNFVPIGCSKTSEIFGFLAHRNVGTELPLHAA